jgi:UDP-N-acetylmuramoyl-tripeptide--D-alanyl-D-alanine ligase
MTQAPDAFPTPFWSPLDLAQALTLDAPPSVPSFSSISIDTRALAPGDLFVALTGASSDGHNFVAQAFKAGACGALVSKPPPHELVHACIMVDDTEQALQSMAKFARKRATTTRVVGLTGSVGKTSVKEGLAHVLKDDGVFATPKSYNNHLGIPLSLAQMPPHIPFAVFEMGMNHAGEIRELARLVRPEIGLITAIGSAHIGNFNNQEEIAFAKAELLEMLTPPPVSLFCRGDLIILISSKGWPSAARVDLSSLLAIMTPLISVCSMLNYYQTIPTSRVTARARSSRDVCPMPGATGLKTPWRSWV